MDASFWVSSISMGIAASGLVGIWFQAREGPAIFLVGIVLVTLCSAMAQEYGFDEK